MNKKGIEISMNVIIVAAIGLLVLVVLSVIFLGRMGGVSENLSNCEVQGGKCAVQCGSLDYGTENHQAKNPTISCPDDAAGDKQVCCLPIRI